MPSCSSYVSCTPDVIDDVTRSQNRSNFEIAISPSIFQLEHESKLKMSEMLMAIFLVYSTSSITFGKKVCRELKMAAILKIFKHSFNLISVMKRSSQIMPKKFFSWWWRHWWRHRVALKFPSIFMFKRGYKGNVSSINENIIIVFLGYTCQKTISMNINE